MPAKTDKTAKTTGTLDIADARRSHDRRAKIIAALYRCMSKRGYAASTLSDIAAEADMSSSHLLYYFPGKDAILVEFFKRVCSDVADEVAALPDDPTARLDAIAHIFVGERRGGKRRRAVMLDLYGQTVQNRELRRMNVAHDKVVIKTLVDVFMRTPLSSDTTAEDAAQSAHAMLIGLRAKSAFDPACDTAQAHRLFRLTLFRLAGLSLPRQKRRRSA